MASVIDKANSAKVSICYDIKYSELQELYELMKTDRFGALVVAFRYGYLKGTRATKAQQKATNKKGE